MTELVVQIEDASLVADLKRAIKMLRGVTGRSEGQVIDLFPRSEGQVIDLFP